MTHGVSGTFFKSEYEKAQEASENGDIAGLSANVTALRDFLALTASSTGFTLDFSTYHNFKLLNSDTAAKTLLITNSPTATDTVLYSDIKIIFSATATITYTSTISWSIGTSATTAPKPSAGGTFIISMISFDQGTSWQATFGGPY